jgi:Transposase
MREKRSIGIDLHRRNFTCCVRLENGRSYLSEWSLEQLPQFIRKLRATDEIAVEVTGNTRLFYQAVAPYVARVVVVDANQFRVISHSVKKTDPNDARNLALYFSQGTVTGGADERERTRGGGQSDPDPRSAGEAANRPEK